MNKFELLKAYIEGAIGSNEFYATIDVEGLKNYISKLENKKEG